MRKIAIVCCTIFSSLMPVYGQSSNASLAGRVTDSQKAVIPGAVMTLTSHSTNISIETTSNAEGIYRLAGLKPDEYTLSVKKDGFRHYQNDAITLNTQDSRILDVSLDIGSVGETVTVEATPINNAESAAVSTVVSTKLIANLPMNGRSLNTLFELTPGVTFSPAGTANSGGMSVNGQRPSANYLTIDGVSGNVAVGIQPDVGGVFSGTSFATTAAGSSAGLLPVDAIQEFRIQTSTFSAEFGRTPGAQIQITSKSGSNSFHGSAYEYFRNNALDANLWFVNANRLAQPALRLNNFGGTLSGPIIRKRLFFFYSHELLSMRQAQNGSLSVPSLAARQQAAPIFRPFLAAFPLPNGPVSSANPLLATYNWAYSTPVTSTSDSLRVDYSLTERIRGFVRYSYSPSKSQPYMGSTISVVDYQLFTLTAGISQILGSHTLNDFRVNWSTNGGSAESVQTTLGGSVPLQSENFKFPGYDFANTTTLVRFIAGNVQFGPATRNKQRQVNIVDTVDLQRGAHNIRLGGDYRMLSPEIYKNNLANFGIGQTADAVRDGILQIFQSIQYYGGSRPVAVRFNNLSTFFQDRWRINDRFTLDYGLRWDLNPAPADELGGPGRITGGFDLSNIGGLRFDFKAGAPWKTRYLNFAPRVGLAYVVRQGNSPLVIRAGWGIFYDPGTAAAAGQFTLGSAPYTASATLSNYPIAQVDLGQLDLRASTALPVGVLWASDPDMRTPWSHQWNVSLEQTVARDTSMSLSYVGSVGRRLIQQASFGNQVPTVATGRLVIATNAGSSDYHSLQMQLRHRIRRGIDALVSYSWAHAIDTASTEATLVNARLSRGASRGSSDFDIRHSLAYGVHYDIPLLSKRHLLNAIIDGWSTDVLGRWFTAPPLNVTTSLPTDVNYSGRPDVVAGEALVISDPRVPGGRRLNAAAFVTPSVPREGSLGRNIIRLFGLSQLDMALSRRIYQTDRVKVVFRAEAFNVTNHPNFAGVGTLLTSGATFGVASTTYAGAYGGGSGYGSAVNGSLNSAFSTGGQRSIQLSLRATF